MQGRGETTKRSRGSEGKIPGARFWWKNFTLLNAPLKAPLKTSLTKSITKIFKGAFKETFKGAKLLHQNRAPASLSLVKTGGAELMKNDGEAARPTFDTERGGEAFNRI